MMQKIRQKPALKRPRLLIIGCGDVGMRLLPLLTPRFRVFAVTRSNTAHERIRAFGAIPLQVDLDDRASVQRLQGLAHWVIHLAPPPAQGLLDSRTRNVVAILPHGACLVYVSTSGVYGDCGGAWIDETRPVAPHNPRALRRVDAETVLRQWALRCGGKLSILRVPGIYAADRLPLERLHKGTPALVASEDGYTNHIHAEDLAHITVQALFHARPNRVYHAVDDSQLQMAEYFDLVADHFGLPRPPRLSRTECQQAVSPMLWSFMAESRRLRNTRIKRELGVRLRYATVSDALQEITIT